MENQASMVLRNVDLIGSYADLMQFATLLLKSKMIPSAVQTPEAAAAIILKGRELGIPMMESFSLINVIQGKPTISPQGMIALARRTRELEYCLPENNEANTVTTVKVKRKGEPEYVTTFSDADAAAMGLANKDNWQKQKAVMRQWRAVSANFRITFPDVIGGLYTPEELGAEVNDEGEVDGSRAIDAEFTRSEYETDTTPSGATVKVSTGEKVAPAAGVESDADGYVSPGAGIPPVASKHWSKDEAQLTKLRGVAMIHNFSKANVLAALNVEEYGDFKGTAEDAMQAMNAYARTHPVKAPKVSAERI